MAAGERRGGNPRTEKEREERHKRLHPGTPLPTRGTGLKKKGLINETIENKLVSEQS